MLEHDCISPSVLRGDESCCFFFDGKCGGHATYPPGYSEEDKVPFACVKEIAGGEYPEYPRAVTRVVDCRSCRHAYQKKEIWCCRHKNCMMGLKPFFENRVASWKVRFPNGEIGVLCDYQPVPVQEKKKKKEGLLAFL